MESFKNSIGGLREFEEKYCKGCVHYEVMQHLEKKVKETKVEYPNDMFVCPIAQLHCIGEVEDLDLEDKERAHAFLKTWLTIREYFTDENEYGIPLCKMYLSGKNYKEVIE